MHYCVPLHDYCVADSRCLYTRHRTDGYTNRDSDPCPDTDTFDSANRSMQTLKDVLEEARTTLQEAQTLIKGLDTETGETAEEARRTLAQTREAAEQAEQTLATLDDTLRGADDARVTATRTFQELSRALKALRNLVDYIQTHPEAVVLGKEPSKEKKR